MLEHFASYMVSKLGPNRIFRFKLGLFSAPFVFILGIVALKLHAADLYWYLIKEDSLIESLTSLTYLMAFLISFSSGVQFYRRSQSIYGGLYILLSMGFLFIFLDWA